MRTTLTIEDDVAVRLERELKARKTSFKALINDVLRRGLDEMDRPAEPRTPYVLCTVDLGERLVPNLDSVAEALAHGEGEAFR